MSPKNYEPGLKETALYPGPSLTVEFAGRPNLSEVQQQDKGQGPSAEFGSYNHTAFMILSTDLADPVGFIRMHTDRHVASTVGTSIVRRYVPGAQFQSFLFYSPSIINNSFLADSIRRLVLRGMRLMLST